MKVKHIIFLFVFCLFAKMSCLAATQVKADDYFNNQNYADAKNEYAQLLLKQPKNQLFLYRYARCCQETGDTENAIKYFELAGDKYDLRDYFLGKLYFDEYRFDESIQMLSRYASKIDTTNVKYSEVDRLLNDAGRMAKYLSRTKMLVVISEAKYKKNDFLKAYSLSESAGSLTLSENGNVCYANERGNNLLYAISDSTSDNNLNIISCSNLVDGLQLCDTLKKPVNTAYNEDFPFASTDGMTLYFASDREGGCGGYDIYVTKRNPETAMFYTPENMGFPFNSPANDYMLAVDEHLGVGYFATDRYCSDDSVVVYKYRLDDVNKIQNVDTDSLRLLAKFPNYYSKAEMPESEEVNDELDEENEDVDEENEDVDLYEQLNNIRKAYDASTDDASKSKNAELILQKEKELLKKNRY